LKKPRVFLFGAAALIVPLLILLSFCSCDKEPTKEEASPSVFAFVNVNVVPMDREHILPTQTVIVQGDLIIEIGPFSEVKIPKNAFRIDGKDKYLMPGLADMHFHNEIENDFVLCLANGITTIRNMWGYPKHLEWRRRIENRELLGPTIITSGPLLDGSPPVVEGSTVIKTVEQARQEVIANKQAGYDFIKIYDRLSLEVFDAIMDEAKQQGIPVAGHIPFAVSLEHAINSGLASNEHLTGYMRNIQADDFPGKGKDDPVSRLRSWMYLDEQKIPAVLERVHDLSIWNCVTLVVYQGLVPHYEALEQLKRPEMKYVDPLIRAYWDPINDPRREKLNEKDFEHRQEMDRVLKKLTAALHKNHGKILLGTDNPNLLVIPGFSIHRELQNLVEAGLTPYAAIKAGTVNAAAFLGDDSFGMVKSGKRADLILVSDNPLADVSSVKRICGVMVKGQWLPHQKLQRMLDDIAASFIPPENRFAEMPPLSPDNEVLFQARFEMRFAGIPMGEERFSIEQLPGGKKRIQAQAVSDYPYSSVATMNMTISDMGRCYSLDYSLETEADKKQAKMIRSENKLKVSGNIVSEEGFERQEDVPEDIFLGASMLSNLVPVVEMAKSLHVGESIEIKGKSIRVLPFWFDSFVLDEAIIIKRAPDENKSLLGDIIAVHVYEMEVSSDSIQHKFTIFADNKGYLLEVHLYMQGSKYEFVHLE